MYYWLNQYWRATRFGQKYISTKWQTRHHKIENQKQVGRWHWLFHFPDALSWIAKRKEDRTISKIRLAEILLGEKDYDLIAS